MIEKKIFSSLFKKDEETEEGVIITITTETPDRQKEILLVAGCDLSNYIKNPIVLTDHKYNVSNAVGKALWIKKENNILKALVKFGTTAYARDVETLVKEGIINSISHTFRPYEYIEDTGGIQKLGFNPDEVRRVYTKWELLEISFVCIPANPEAVVQEIKRKNILLKTDFFNTEKETEYEKKSVIPYHKLPKADENYKWNGAEAIKRIGEYAIDREGNYNEDKLKKCFCWVEKGKEENITAYKLPIADIIDGTPHLVWRAVAAAMAALLGARAGGLNIPDNDKKGIYEVLTQYYNDFEKEPPDFVLKEYKEVIVNLMLNYEDRLDNLENIITDFLGKSELSRERQGNDIKEIIQTFFKNKLNLN